MVLQVPNTPDPDQIGRALDTIFERWPELPEDSIAHVFGDHTEQSFGRHRVPYIQPQRVQDSTWVRVLIAKDAISTGWDCPRAEVMVSFRAATDETHITQLLGRMVRSPLAMRIPGSERLNSVDCLLPFFNEEAAKKIAKALTSGGEGEGELVGRRVLINPTELTQNPDIPAEVWDLFNGIPSQALPKKHAKPIKRLTSLAHELAADDLLKDAGKKAHAEMHRVLDGLRVRYSAEISTARQNVLTVEGRTGRATMGRGEMTFDDFVEEADFVAIEDAYRRAGRSISPDLATTYAAHLARKDGETDDMETALMESQVVIASLGLVTQIRVAVEEDAEKLSNKWLTHFRVDITGLTDERQEVYRQIREMSADPLDVSLALPTSAMQPTTLREANGTETPLPLYDRHLLCDAAGMFPAEFNSWEEIVIQTELARNIAVAWYRNPSRGAQESLGIVYQADGEAKILRPDFIFFSVKADGSISMDIVDPHGIQFGDAIPKLQGLADYAERYGDQFRRIEGVAKIGEKFRVINLKDPGARAAVAAADSITSLFAGTAASDYLSS